MALGTQDWYTSEELAAYQATKPCPPWARPNASGWCVEKWWAGGPMAALLGAATTVVGMAALGVVLVYLGKLEILKPVVGLLQKSPGQGKMAANRRTRRRRRGRRY